MAEVVEGQGMRGIVKENQKSKTMLARERVSTFLFPTGGWDSARAVSTRTESAGIPFRGLM